MSAVYNLFLRNWKNGRASEEQIVQAVSKGLITEEDAVTIMANEIVPL